MTWVGQLFTLQKDENYESFIGALKLPAEQVEGLKKYKPSVKITQNGDSYTQTITTGSSIKEITFKSGVEFDEKVRETITAKSTATVAGDTVTHVQKYPGGQVFTFVKEFSGNTLKETITTSFWDGTAFRYYSA